jgi:serine/threonine protein kinase
MDIKFESEEIKKFLSEGKLLQKYSHKNIVQFIGIAVDSDPIKIVMEFIDGGSLHRYLRENYDLPMQQVLKFSEECALGMEYLASNRVVHRDLAARNCLLTKDLTLKITDFGLSRQLEDGDEVYEMNALKSIPIRWSAPVS